MTILFPSLLGCCVVSLSFVLNFLLIALSFILANSLTFFLSTHLSFSVFNNLRFSRLVSMFSFPDSLCNTDVMIIFFFTLVKFYLII